MKLLKQGDTIGICAPSARFDNEKFQRGVLRLESMGFKVKVPEQIYEKKRYLAGEDILRAQIVESLFVDSDIQGILCARGGFGAMRILKYLNWSVLKKNPTPLIGFSDSTALLLSIVEKTGQPVIHGPTLLSLSNAHQDTLTSFYDVLTSKVPSMNSATGQCLVPGECSGILMGGNLATISHMVGTPFQPDFTGAILFFEDVGEPAYKIDRMLYQLKLAGVLNGIKGVVCGNFTDCENESYIDEIILEVFTADNIPILSRFEAGHGAINHSFVMGRPVILDAALKTLSWV